MSKPMIYLARAIGFFIVGPILFYLGWKWSMITDEVFAPTKKIF
jgi:hypothetical protein